MILNFTKCKNSEPFDLTSNMIRYESLILEVLKESDFNFSTVVKQATHMLSENYDKNQVIRLLAIIYIERGDKISSLRYIESLNLDDMIKTYTSENDSLINFAIICVFSHELLNSSDFKNALKYFLYARNIAGSRCPLGLLKHLANCQTKAGFFADALNTYQEILSIYPTNLEINSKSKVNGSQSTDSTIETLSTSLWPDLFGKSGWVPLCLQNILEFNKASLIETILDTVTLSISQSPPLFSKSIAFMRRAYRLCPKSLTVLIRIADLGHLQNMRDLEDFYIGLIWNIIPSSSLIKKLLQIDPIVFTSTDGGSKAERDIANMLPAEFRASLTLLVESLIVVARNHVRHENYYSASNFLNDAAVLMGLEFKPDVQDIPYKYASPLTVSPSLGLKFLFLRLIIKCSLELEEFKQAAFYGQVIIKYCYSLKMYVRSCRSHPDISATMGFIMIKLGEYDNAKLHFQTCLSQLRNNKKFSNIIPFESVGTLTTPLFSLTLDKFSFVWEPFILKYSDTKVAESKIVEALLDVAEHPSVNDLQIQKSCLSYLCSYDLTNIILRYKLAVIAENENKTLEAESIYTRILRSDPRNVEVCLRKDFEAAYDILVRVKESKELSTCIPYLDLLATTALQNNRVHTAVKLWEQTIEINNFYMQGLYQLGLVYFRDLKDFVLAKFYMNRVLACSKSTTSILSNKISSSVPLLTSVFSCPTHLELIKNWASIVLAELLLFEGDLETSQDVLQAVCSIYNYMQRQTNSTKVGKTRYNLLFGRLQLMIFNFNEAYMTLKNVIDTEQNLNDLAEGCMLAAQALERLGRLDEAFELANRCYNIDSLCLPNLTTLAWITSRRLARDCLDEPIRLCQIGERLDSLFPLPKLFRGYFYLLKKKYYDATELLEAAYDRLQHVWTFDIYARCNCPKHILSCCQLYILLVRHQDVTWITINDIPESNLEKIVLSKNVIDKLRNDSVSFNNVLSEVKDLIKSNYSIYIDSYLKIIQDKLGSEFLLHDSHWNSVTSLLVCIAYKEAGKPKILDTELTRQLSEPTPCSKAKNNRYLFQQQLRNQQEQRQRYSNYNPFKEGEHFIPNEYSNYSPHPKVYIPIVNDPLNRKSTHVLKKKDVVNQSKIQVLYDVSASQYDRGAVLTLIDNKSTHVSSSSPPRIISTTNTPRSISNNQRQTSEPKIMSRCILPEMSSVHKITTLDKGFQSIKVLLRHEFSITKILGRGGYGTVYAGKLFKSNLRVAVKQLHVNLKNIKLNKWNDIMSEIQAMFYLNHPSLIELVGICFEKIHLSIITELCRNGSLHASLHVKKNLPINWDIRQKIALQITDGIRYLHALTPKVIHRDLKSLNIVLDAKWNAKICDFGLTTSMDLCKTHISLKPGANGGSPRYMAPECYKSSGKVSEKVDIWSLGCILIEIFGGPVPYYNCKDIQHIVNTLLVQKKIPSIPIYLSPQLQRIIKGCLRFEPKLRWTADKVFDQLKELREFTIYVYN